MSRILFVTFHAGGNLAPALGIGAELKRRGHSVTLLGDRAQADTVRAAGVDFVRYRTEPSWIATEERSDAAAAWSTIRTATGRARADQAAELAATLAADLVVVDCVLLSTINAIAAAGFRHAILYHFFYHYADNAAVQFPLGLATRMIGLPYRSLWSDADVGIVCSDRVLDPTPQDRQLANVVWTGVVGHNPESAPSRSSDRRVLASLSTISYRGMRQVWQNIFDGVRDTSIELIATTGPAINHRDLDIPDNVSVYKMLPHDEVMQTCTAVICHGGHATTTRALSHGLPVAVLPMHPLLDQPMVGSAVARIGAGIRLAKNERPEGIRAATLRLVNEPSYRDAARAAGARITATDGASTAADLLIRTATAPR